MQKYEIPITLVATIEKGINDDENKIIELRRGDRVDKIKYSQSDVEAIREMGIPVLEEEYSEDFDWVNADAGGGVETRR